LTLPTKIVPLLYKSQLEVNAGIVWAYEQYKDDCHQFQAISNGMEKAKAKRLGIWNGNPQPPWDFRQANK
jgi:endonuclease YncB( thermonuclease family)